MARAPIGRTGILGVTITSLISIRTSAAPDLGQILSAIRMRTLPKIRVFRTALFQISLSSVRLEQQYADGKSYATATEEVSPKVENRLWDL